MEEEWRNVVLCDTGYRVSNTGKIYSLKSEKELKPKTDRYGYLIVGLPFNGKWKSVTVHRIVASTFLENPNLKKEINHIDFDRKNNNVLNLEFVTRSENQKHRYTRPVSKTVIRNQSKLTVDDILFIRTAHYMYGMAQVDICRATGIKRSSMSKIIHYRTFR